ncbi:MAG: hypothetical protein GC182_03080 [Rhodopseudomonas sp.]|nr:hypothetical protein [Rhodopseudomonas sp.]
MFGVIFTWFATSKAGRAIAAGAALALAIGIAVLKVFNAGKASERAAQDRASLDNMRERQATDDEVANLGPADLDRRMRRWVRDDEQM